MKVFVSAYACEPYKGSEPGIGWNFVNEMSNYNEVHVLTRANNRESIEASLEDHQNPNLVFHYYDLPKALRFWKKGRRGYQLYYYLWQIFIYFKFKNFINTRKFDIVHHLTFGANWMPSLLMMTKPKTIWGPVGSEDIYKPIIKTLPSKIRFKEFLRSMVKTFFYYIEPIRWLTILNADLILNHSSKYANYKYPKFLQHKAQDYIQTGLNTSEPEYQQITSMKVKEKGAPVRLIISSELIAWKGVVIASEVFARIAKMRNDVELIVLGEGSEKKQMEKIFVKYEVKDKVTFKGYVSKDVLIQELYEADLLLYPAYHHGLATLILQSMYAYLPIISMEGDIISEVIHDKCGLAVGGKNYDAIIENLIAITEKLIDAVDLRDKYALEGRRMVEITFKWEKLVKQMDKVYKGIC
ncbi:MAG: glycosyltransferase [Helicobacteraceae bacterium]|nr:glycosyltransferase [Helicobacteraceae bacterium]